MSPRLDLSMSDAEVADLLGTPGQTMAVATVAPDGQPHLTAVWYGFTEDGTIGFTAPARSQKVRNLQRDRRITVLVESGRAHGQLRGVQLAGTAALTGELDVKLEISRSIAQRYDALRHDDPERAMRNRVAVLLHATKAVSWDHRKIPPRRPRD